MSKEKFAQALQYIDEHIKPQQKYIKDPVEYQVFRIRNKCFFWLSLIGSLIHIFLSIQTYGTDAFGQNVTLLGFGIVSIIVFFLTIKLNPKVFGHLIVAIMLLTHIQTFQGNEKAVLLAYNGSGASFLGLLMTGKPMVAIGIALFQLIWNITFKILVKDALRQMGEEFVDHSLTPTLSSMIFSAIAMSLMVHQLRVQFRKNLEVTEKNQYNERHKTLLLGFSHELRNIVQSLLGQISLIKEEFVKDEESLKYLKNSHYLGDQLVHQINNILDSGKVDVDELEIAPKLESSWNLFPKIWEICSRMIQRDNIQGSIRIDKSIPNEISIDDHRLMQIMLNLMGNAIKFTNEGRIDIKIDWIKTYGYSNINTPISEKDFEPIPFKQSVNKDEEQDEQCAAFEKDFNLSCLSGNYVCIYQNKNIYSINKNQSLGNNTSTKGGILRIIFRDTGVGIQESDLEKIFGLFSQTSDPNRKKLGTGIGLFITKHLVERMKGQIRVYSKLGMGTIFIICIPIEEVKKNYGPQSLGELNSITHSNDLSLMNRIQSQLHISCKNESSSQKINWSSINSLIVDDETFIRNFMDQVLKSVKIKIRIQASNGFKAIEEFKLAHREGKPINLITMDITMPECDGKKAAEEIRKYERQNRLRECIIIFVTGNISASEQSECMDKRGSIRGNGFLRKPVSKSSLEQQIKQFFEER